MFLFSSQAIRMFFAGCPQSVPPASPWGYGLVSSALLGLCLLVNAPMAQAGTSSTDVYVNGTKKDTGTGNDKDIVEIFEDSGVTIEIKSSSGGNTGAFEPGSVTINPDAHSTGTRNNNKIVMTGGTMGFKPDNAHHIMAAKDGDILSNNQILISGGTITNGSEITMAGGYTFAGNSSAQGNKVEISGDAVIDGTKSGKKFTIYGAYADGEVSENTVTLKPDTGKVDGGINIYGGASQNGTAKDNSVEIGGEGNVSVNAVYGGYARSGDATGNTVILGGGAGNVTVRDSVYGGSSVNQGETMGNSVTINGGAGTVSVNKVYGAKGSTGTNFVTTRNSVTIKGGAGDVSVTKVYGAYSLPGNVNQNSVTINGGAGNVSVDEVYGGYSDQRDATNNTVTIGGGTGKVSVGSVYGGGSVWGGNATGNTVTIKGGAGNFSVQEVYGGSSESGNATGNTVTIGEGTGNVTVSNSVYGGSSQGGDATGNTVTIGEGTGTVTVDDYVYGGSSESGNATGNTVTIGSGTGNVTVEKVYGGFSKEVSATGNTVTIGGGTGNVSVKKVYGGFSIAGSATNNTVILKGAPGTSAEIYGGGTPFRNSVDVRTGNTLEVYTKGISIAQLGNFQNYNFYLPSGITNGDTVLTVTDGAVDISTPTSSAAKTSVGVGMQGGARLNVGDSINLIYATGGLTADSGMTNTLTARQGISREYTFTLSTTNDKLIATVGDAPTPPGPDPDPDPGPGPGPDPGPGPKPDPTPTPKPDPVQKTDEAIRKSPAEGRAASVSLVTQGADLASAQGMASAREAAKSMAAGANPLGIGGFAAMSGGVSRYNTGSHVDADGFSFMAGLAKRIPLSGVDLVAGVFFEAGFGSYSTYNNTAKDESIRGFGNNNYMGGGILGRMDITESALKGLYVETALRMGNIHTSYNSDDLNPALGRADYDTDSTYVGVNAGLGYVWELSEKASLDLYGKYFWTHTSSADVEIFNDPVHFDAVNSHRTRFGARFAYQVNENISPYVGAAWEHEFDNNSRSTVAGDSIAAPTTKGSSGLGELGLTWKPSAESGLSVDLGAQGYAGVRQGVSGNLQMKYEF